MGFFPQSIKFTSVVFACMGGIFFLVGMIGCAAPESGGSLTELEGASQASADSSVDAVPSSPPFDPQADGLELYDGLVKFVFL